MSSAQPLWKRALSNRAKAKILKENRGAMARLVLVNLLVRCGVAVTLVEVHRWPRPKQGVAYLWAIARIEGREDVPYPFGDE